MLKLELAKYGVLAPSRLLVATDGTAVCLRYRYVPRNPVEVWRLVNYGGSP
jgi:hypothetical protein